MVQIILALFKCIRVCIVYTYASDIKYVCHGCQPVLDLALELSPRTDGQIMV